jgi:hypothetical protein
MRDAADTRLRQGVPNISGVDVDSTVENTEVAVDEPDRHPTS